MKTYKVSVYDLPFVMDTPGMTLFWIVCPTGNYMLDIDTGHRYADNLAFCMSHTGDTTLLRKVVNAIHQLEEMSGIEVGFLSRLACLAVYGTRAI